MTAYDELYAYTIGRPHFILQHVVDAQGAQAATADQPAIRLVFSLAGLYLHLERGFDGVQVQNAHRLMAKTKRAWPAIPLPQHRGTITPVEVLQKPAGRERDAAIEDWCRAVWESFEDSRQTIAALTAEYKIG